MNKKDFLKCPLGIYRIHWKSGGSSVAAVGYDYAGNRWIAPTNWTCEVGGNPTSLLKKQLKEIDNMELIATQHG